MTNQELKDIIELSLKYKKSYYDVNVRYGRVMEHLKNKNLHYGLKLHSETIGNLEKILQAEKNVNRK